MNSSKRILIVGGVAGGMSAATRLRRQDERAEIVVFERGDYVSFANCGLPYFLGEVIPEREDLLLQTPQALKDRFEIDVRVRHEVISIDTDAQTVLVRDLVAGSETHESYDDLVLSPGARPVVPPLPGIERALTLRDLADVDRMHEAVAGGPQDAVIIGGGFIGLELAENLTRRGIGVTVIEAADQIMPPLDPEMAYLVEQELVRHGIRVELGVQVTTIGDETVTLSDGRDLRADLVVLAIGVQPESSLARDAGIALGARGAIVVDDHQRTSVPHIFAVGDAVEKLNAVHGGSLLAPLANTANRQGRLVADVISGQDTRMRPTFGTAIVGLFDIAAGVTGASEKRLRAEGRAFRAVHTHPFSHAGYYPGAEQMSIKLLIDPETDAILGAQAVGGQGVDKRIDVLATAMSGGLKASELADLELAYAPQFGSAKDPVNMLGFIAENLRDGMSTTVQWNELSGRVESGSTVIDVRTRDEFQDAHIAHAINIPLDEIRERLNELPAGDLIVHCAVGQRGHTAARILSQSGFAVSNLDGGLRTWQAGLRRAKETAFPSS
ncbi:CoA-disulfide reductase [soil metagenome]